MDELLEAPALLTDEGINAVLSKVDVNVALNDLIEEVTISQTYQNRDEKNIEAIYTFPLPAGAVLLELKVRIGERELRGLVVERSLAEEQYEQAVTDGDLAVLLQQVRPGIYTANLGNLRPGDSVTVTYRYARLHKWMDAVLRFYLPTTIAPRYGDPGGAGLEPHQFPEYDLFAEHRYTFRMRVTGILKDAEIECPTHAIRVERQEDAACVHLEGGSALLDRDLIVLLKADHMERNTALAGRDLDGHYVLMAAFQPRFPARTEEEPGNLKIVMDCSGSMNGDSILQSRRGLRLILESLRPQDYFNIITFGSRHSCLFPGQVPADAPNLARAMRLADGLQADMGGTEMHSALMAACRIRGGPDTTRNILLITDGEVWAVDRVVQSAAASGHRVFTVGVGSSAAGEVLRNLAERTGGSCECVTPKENMGEGIYRHFQRMYRPQARKAAVRYPLDPVQTVEDSLKSVFHGDTVHVFGRFSQKPEGAVAFNASLSDGSMIHQEAMIGDYPDSNGEPPGTLARLMAAGMIDGVPREKAVKTAVKYQLITPYTNVLVIDVRKMDEKAKDLPEAVKVPNMVAAGWGGLGSVQFPAEMDVDFCLASPSDDIHYCFIGSETKKPFLSRIHEKLIKVSQEPCVTIQDLSEAGIGAGWIKELIALVNEGFSEEDVVQIFLLLYGKRYPEHQTGRDRARVIRRNIRNRPDADVLKARIQEMIDRGEHQ